MLVRGTESFDIQGNDPTAVKVMTRILLKNLYGFLTADCSPLGKYLPTILEALGSISNGLGLQPPCRQKIWGVSPSLYQEPPPTVRAHPLSWV